MSETGSKKMKMDNLYPVAVKCLLFSDWPISIHSWVYILDLDLFYTGSEVLKPGQTRQHCHMTLFQEGKECFHLFL